MFSEPDEMKLKWCFKPVGSYETLCQSDGSCDHFQLLLVTAFYSTNGALRSSFSI